MSKTKIIANEIVENSDTRRIIFRILLGSLLLLSIVYMYIIGSITFNVVARKSLEKTSIALGSSISQLELTYLSNMNDISKARASTLGFVDTKSNIFAKRYITSVAMR